MAARRFRLEPLAEATGLTLPALGRALRLSGSQWKRARDEGVGELAADRYAVRMSLHPANVWVEIIDDEIARQKTPCGECGVEFLPTRKGHAFCSKNCRERQRMRIKYQANDVFRAAESVRRRAYYAACADYEKASAKRRYWAAPEHHRQARRARHHAAAVDA